MQLSLQYPAWYFLLCILLGAAAAFALYFRDKQFKELGETFRKWIGVMAVIRFLSVSFLFFMLLSPLIRTLINRVEKPIIVLLQDDSQSVKMKGADSANYANSMTALAKSLADQYEVKEYSFSSSLKEGLDFSFAGNTSNLSSALDQVSDIYINQNLGAVIVATDGIYNEGSNPVYTSDQIHAPVYTIGLGDTTVKKDLILSNVYYNRSVFLGDYFPVKAEWTADFCANENATITISEISSGKEQQRDTKEFHMDANQDRGSTEFMLMATEAGMKHYRITLSKIDGEVSVMNNVKDVFIDVVEKREKILILANAPHPDVAALKQSIEETRNYRVDVNIGTGNVPALKEYTLVILYQLPSANDPSIVQTIHAQKKSVMFILGAQSGIGLFNNSQTLVSINGNNGTTTDALPVVNADFTLFTLPEIVRQNLTAFPPLASPFGDYKVSPSSVVLFNQKIGNVSTEYPLILFQQNLDGRSCVIAGEGLWRWRMWDYEQHKNQDAFNALISSIIQFLAVKPEERQFRVRPEKEMQSGGNRIFSGNESVIFHAELLNESNQLINDPDVSLNIKDEGGKEFPFLFSKTGNAYSVNAGFFPEGNYNWQARTKYNNKDLTAAGSFSVTPIQLELVNTRADHRLLYQLSEKTGGKLFYPSQLKELAADIEKKSEIKPVLYSTTRTEPLINLRWLIIPILLLFSLEWGIRKFNGGY